MVGFIIEIHDWTFNLIWLSKWEGRGASMEILKSWWNVPAAHCSVVESIRLFYEVPLRYTSLFCALTKQRDCAPCTDWIFSRALLYPLLVIITNTWVTSQINIWQGTSLATWFLGEYISTQSKHVPPFRSHKTVWMPCGMKKGLKSLDTGLFWMCSSVLLSLTQHWLLLGTTSSLRHVRQSLKRVAAER